MLINTKTLYLHKILPVVLVIIYLLADCVVTKKTAIGITFVASRGSSPPAQRIVLSLTDENKVLATGYETLAEPAEVYILDVQTGKKNDLVKQQPAYFFDKTAHQIGTAEKI
jgi:hypothetical protein